MKMYLRSLIVAGLMWSGGLMAQVPNAVFDQLEQIVGSIRDVLSLHGLDVQVSFPPDTLESWRTAFNRVVYKPLATPPYATVYVTVVPDKRTQNLYLNFTAVKNETLAPRNIVTARRAPIAMQNILVGSTQENTELASAFQDLTEDFVRQIEGSLKQDLGHTRRGTEASQKNIESLRGFSWRGLADGLGRHLLILLGVVVLIGGVLTGGYGGGIVGAGLTAALSLSLISLGTYWCRHYEQQSAVLTQEYSTQRIHLMLLRDQLETLQKDLPALAPAR